MSTTEPPFDSQTSDRIENIIKDARYVPLVCIAPVVFLVCSPFLALTFGLLSTGWLMVRLIQWYIINARHGRAFKECVVETPYSPYAMLAVKFRRSEWLLWVGVMFWPTAVAGLYYYLRYHVWADMP